jgi:hypothetical protein
MERLVHDQKARRPKNRRISPAGRARKGKRHYRWQTEQSKERALAAGLANLRPKQAQRAAEIEARLGRFRAGVLAQLGGEEKVSEAQRALVESSALSLAITLLAFTRLFFGFRRQKWLLTALTAHQNTLRLNLERLGVLGKGEALGDPVEELHAYLAEKYGAKGTDGKENSADSA